MVDFTTLGTRPRRQLVLLRLLRKWRIWPERRKTLPFRVTRKRLTTDFLVFNFILGFFFFIFLDSLFGADYSPHQFPLQFRLGFLRAVFN